ncbi:MAG: nucleotidyltransferase domain-containing protein [Candidatus Brocadiae bacterium]|nr:nucleotidyltransferase domain-containing protein [Candidatus Brocadiia bacterium]
MDKGAALNAISRFRRALEAGGIRVARIVLYGSHAEGTAREESDIDLVVISEDFADKGYWQRLELLSDAIYKVFEPIEAVAMTPEEWDSGDSLIAQYARDGEVL